ncbi:hypothetical protein CCAX7_26750 [Capsulimonas corticalis]|uniref:DUF2314 domain-containing protein n=1 Tax=Capsulimonas corticalis TaxID=2219043 RepID=A0A402CTS4_9BACT|nr:DUF2314 domain-containing protein [Capsulimonas corticalis]BDI30624.1 hypothetical protein CCAX7_26750 [Capsulimonas corticalis]
MPQPTITLPIPETVPTGFMIFCRFTSAPPTDADVSQMARMWALENADPPLREMIGAFIDPTLMVIHVAETSQVPIEILRACAPSLAEDQRGEIDSATHFITVRASDHLPGPRLGLWAAVAATMACAERYGARVVLDADTCAAFPLKNPFRELHMQMTPRVASFVVCPYSMSDSGAATMTTRGMARFGLPDLLLGDIPPIDMQALAMTVVGLCQVLVTMVGDVHRGDDSPAPFIPSILETVVTASYLKMSRSREMDTPPANKNAEARVRLEHRPRPGYPLERYFTLLPPEGYSGEYGAWLHSLVSTFFQIEDTMHEVFHGDGMEQAHRRAIAELPAVKQRYLSGALGPWRFGVKYGFPVGDPRDDNHEYMWVFVREWVGGRIAGELVNTPQMRTDLRAGQRIDLTETDVFDWIIVGPNGPQEGGYTDRDFTSSSATLDASSAVTKSESSDECPSYVLRRSDPEFRARVEATGRAEVRNEYEQFLLKTAGLPYRCFVKTAPWLVGGAVIWKWSAIAGMAALIIGVWQGWRAVQILRGHNRLKHSYQEVSEFGEYNIAMPFVFESSINPDTGVINFPSVFMLFQNDDSDPTIIHDQIAECLSKPMQNLSSDALEISTLSRRIRQKRAMIGRRTRIPDAWVGGKTVYVVDMTTTTAFVESEAFPHLYVPCLSTPGDKGAVATISKNVVVKALET